MPQEQQHEAVAVPNYIRAFCAQSVKAVDEEKREVVHLITNPAVDRVGDIVDPKGVDLTNYVKNPVVMADHHYSIGAVIGKATDISVGDDGITARTQFRDTPLAREAFALSVEGLGGWSIGFRPTVSHSIREGKRAACKVCEARWKEATRGKDPADAWVGGWHFTGWEMLEYSSVAIPMNPDIVNNAVKRGLVSPDHVRSFFLVSEAEAQPVESTAGPGPNAEAPTELHPAMARAFERALGRASLRVRNWNLERGIAEALEKFHGR